jgi:glycosyltransferase involved in cell wall biosynthesis
LYADDETAWNCSAWRCHLLSNAINWQREQTPKEFPHSAAMYFMQTALDIHHPSVQSKIGMADVIVWQRNVIAQEMYDAMDYWRALGKINVVDLDDHYPAIPASNPAFNYWIRNINELDPNPVERLKEGLRRADALIAPSEVLLKDWEGTVPGYVWPNYPPLKDYENLDHRKPGSRDLMFTYETVDDKPAFTVKPRPDSAGNIYIGWGGSMSHVDSFVYSEVVPALARILTERPNVFFKFCGHDERMNWLFDKLPKEKFIRQGGVDPKNWPQVVASFDIGIAPLDMREVTSNTGKENPGYSYDERRSWLKLVEYVCAGVPFVATDGAPYHELGKFGKVVDNTEADWYAALSRTINTLPAQYEQAQNNRRYALKSLTQEANAKRLISLYEKIGTETQVRRQGAKLPQTLYVN